MIKKILMAIALLFVLIVIGFFVVNSMLPDWIKHKIVAQGFQVDEVQYSLFDPYSIQLSQLNYQDEVQGIELNIQKAKIHLQKNTSRLEVEIETPKFKFVPPKSASETTPATAPGAPKPAAPAARAASAAVSSGGISPPDLSALEGYSLNLKIEDGSFQIYDFRAQQAKIDLSFDRVDDPWSVTFQSENRLGPNIKSTSFPIELQAKVVGLSKGSVKIDDLKLLCMGMPLEAKVSYEFSKDAGLAKITGKKLVFTPNLKGGGASLEGQVGVDAEIEAAWNGRLTLPSALVTVDMVQAKIKWGDQFTKPEKTRFKLTFEGTSTQDEFTLKKAEILLAQLEATAQGTVALLPGQTSQLDVQIKKTSLQGMEKLFPPLSGAPLKGQMELTAAVGGDFSRPDSIEFKLKPLVLDQVSGKVHWASAESTVDVIILLDAKSEVEAKGTDLTEANLDAKLDLTQVDLVFPGYFQKKKGVPFALKVVGRKKDQGLELQSSNLKLLSSVVEISGKLSDPKRPHLNLNFKIPNFSLGELSGAMPALKEKMGGLQGTGNLQADLSGIYDFKDGLERSPLELKGQIALELNSFQIPKAAPQAAAPQAQSAMGPLLPDWPILKSADITAKLGIAGLSYDSLSMGRVEAQGRYNETILKGKVDIQKLFSGSVNVTSFDVPLMKVGPDFVAQTSFTNINLEQMAVWWNPQWKGLIRGLGTGQIKIDVPNNMIVAGDIKVTQARLSTMQVNQRINEQLSKIPVIGDQAKVTTRDVAGELVGRFRWDQGRLELNPFDFKGEDHSDLELMGWLALDRSVSLKGVAYLARPPVRGAVLAANSDSSGRLRVPITLTGNLMNPSLSIAEETIREMTERTVKHEAAEKLEQVQTRARAVVEEQVKKGLGGLLKR